METFKRLPRWARRLLVITTIVGPVCGATWTIASTVIDIRSKAREAKTRSTAGYETLAPAIKELQVLSEETQAQANRSERRILELERANTDLEKRVIRLEAYIDIISRRRNMPKPPAEVKPTPATVMSDAPPAPRIKKPVRPVPQSINKATTYQQQRSKMRCEDDDPLCGALE